MDNEQNFTSNCQDSEADVGCKKCLAAALDHWLKLSIATGGMWVSKKLELADVINGNHIRYLCLKVLARDNSGIAYKAIVSTNRPDPLQYAEECFREKIELNGNSIVENTKDWPGPEDDALYVLVEDDDKVKK